jgi:hypothetical protein
MEITYYLSEADILALSIFRAGNDPIIKKRIFQNRLRLIISFTVVGIGLWLVTNDLLFLIAFILLSILSFLFYYQYYTWRLKRRVIDTYKDSNYKSSLASRTLSANSEGLVEISSLGQMKIDWKKVDDFFETPTHLFISVGQIASITIPKNPSAITAGDLNIFISACRSLKEQAA